MVYKSRRTYVANLKVCYTELNVVIVIPGLIEIMSSDGVEARILKAKDFRSSAKVEDLAFKA
jgi:hypothetical protein